MDLSTRTQKRRQYQRDNEVKWWRLKDQAVADDYANDVIDNMEYCEQSEWTIFSETEGQRPLRGHDWWQVHAGTGDLVVEYNSPGGNSQEKDDVQEVATIESTRRSCYLQRGKENCSS